MISSEEDKEYFSSAKYRDVIKSHMLRSKDIHHMIYFFGYFLSTGERGAVIAVLKR